MKTISMLIVLAILGWVVALNVAYAAKKTGFKCQPITSSSTTVAEFRCDGENPDLWTFDIKIPYCSFKSPPSEALCVNSDDDVTTQKEFLRVTKPFNGGSNPNWEK